MLVRKSLVDQIEHRRTGEVLVRFGIIIEEDGKELSCNWHRVCIPQETDEQLQMQHIVAHFEVLGYPPLPEADINWVISSCVFNKAVRPM